MAERFDSAEITTAVLRQAQCHAYLARALDDPNLDLAEGAR
jgi:hypothetical protein